MAGLSLTCYTSCRKQITFALPANTDWKLEENITLVMC